MRMEGGQLCSRGRVSESVWQKVVVVGSSQIGKIFCIYAVFLIEDMA